MSPRPGRSVARTVAVASLSVCLLSGMAVGVQAEDGLGGFFQRLFAPPPSTPALREAAPLPFATVPGERPAASLRRRRTRYASLPRSEPLPIRVGERQTPLDLKDGATAAFLKDDTLRPGDIVVLKSGAHVFKGSPGRRHALGDFDPAERSARLDRKTRALLAGMVAPRGALSAEAARRMGSRALATPQAEPTRTEASLVRVVSPWRTTP